MRAATDDAPSERLVRHVFWKYPLLAVILTALIAAVAFATGSPDSPRATIAGAASSDPGGAVLAFTQELDGTSSSGGNTQEYGMGPPAQVFILGPLHAALPLLGSVSVTGMPHLGEADVSRALSTYGAAGAEQRMAWAMSYQTALGTITPQASGQTAMGMLSGMSTASPDFAKLRTLRGDFGPVPTLEEADLFLAQTGYLEQYLQAADPGHSFQLTNIWLYDHPQMLNTAVAQGLTDDQWGMVKERGFPVGPWYLAIPAVFHVYLPFGSTGVGFMLWNLLFAFLLLFAVPLLPGLRSLPSRLKLYRFIYRYPTRGELERIALAEDRAMARGSGAWRPRKRSIEPAGRGLEEGMA